MKRQVKLAESDLRQMITEAVEKAFKKLNEGSDWPSLREGQKLSNEDLIDMIKNPDKYKYKTNWGSIDPAEFNIYNDPEKIMNGFMIRCKPDNIESNMQEFQEFLAGNHEDRLIMVVREKIFQKIDPSQLPEPDLFGKDKENNMTWGTYYFTGDDVAYWKVRCNCGFDQIALDPVFKNDYVNKVWAAVHKKESDFAKYFFDKYGTE